MYTGKLVFAQAMDHLPLHPLQRCIQRYHGNRHVKRFSCQDQYRCIAFAPLTYRESLRDIQACLNAQSDKLYHMGIRKNVARSTLAEVNERGNIPSFIHLSEGKQHDVNLLDLQV
jgi:hypothetical protein